MLSFKKVNISFIFIVLPLFILLKSEQNISNWLIFLFVLIWLTITVIGSFHIRWNYFIKGYHKNNQIHKNVVSITFDDGPNNDYTPKVLALLKKHKAKATFFCIGKNVKSHPEVLKEIVKEGHLIGNHSYSHKNTFGFLNSKKVREEIEETSSIIEEITGLKVRFFRPPFGVTNPNIAKAVANLNLFTFGWSIRSLDTIATDPEKVYKKITSRIKKGEVVLMHDTSELSIQVLEKVLNYLEDNHIKTITLDKLFNLKAYG